MAGCGKTNEQETVKYSDIFNDGKESISYLVKNSSDNSTELGKDSEISKFIVSKNGEIAVYGDYSELDYDENEYATVLGKMIKMNDDEKMDYIKKMDKQSFNADKEYQLSDIQNKIGSTENNLDEAKERSKDNDYDVDEHAIDGVPEIEFYTKQVTNLKKDLKKASNVKYEEPSYNKLDISVTTDESGNNTKSEFINIGAQTFDEDSENGVYRTSKESSKDYGINVSNVVSPTEIYDAKIAGLSNIDNVEEDNDFSDPAYDDYEYLVTEVGDKTEKFELDKPDDDSVTEK